MTTRPPTMIEMLAQSDDRLVPPPQFEGRITKLTADEREFVAKYAADSIRDFLMFQSPQGRVRAWENALAENRKLKAVQAENLKAEQAPAPQESGAPKSGAPVAVVTRMSDIERKPVKWLWRLYIPRGMPTVVDGHPGTGKSVMLVDLTARVTTGRPMPDGSTSGPPRSVIILSAEDDAASVIRPRLEVAGGDLSRVIRIQMQTDKETRDPVITDQDVAECLRVIKETEVALLIVDPLVAYLQDGTDTHNDHSIRRALAPLKPIFDQTDCAVVAIRHWKKASTDIAIHRGGGSIGTIAFARAGLAVGTDPEDETKKTRVLAVAKMNLAQIAPSLQFQTVGVRLKGQADDEEDIVKVEWLGVSSLSANDLTAEPPPRRDTPALDEAKAFLRDLLTAGPVHSKEVKREAQERDIRPDTLKKAKKELNVRSVKEGFGKESHIDWVLDSTPAPYDGGES